MDTIGLVAIPRLLENLRMLVSWTPKLNRSSDCPAMPGTKRPMSLMNPAMSARLVARPISIQVRASVVPSLRPMLSSTDVKESDRLRSILPTMPRGAGRQALDEHPGRGVQDVGDAER